jgi:hypothetical protein
VLFSAKADLALRFIYDNWRTRKVDRLVSEPRAIARGNEYIEVGPLIDAVFSRSHLTMAGNPLDGGVARIPSKNLRIVDPSLQHVVIVDDIPSRILPEQQFLLKAQPKFDAKNYLESERERRGGDSHLYRYYNSILTQTVDEILESSDRASGARTGMTPSKVPIEPMPFAQAFRPYSYAGRRVYDALNYSLNAEPDPLGFFKSKGKRLENLSREAMETARTRPELYTAAFDAN